MGVSRSTTWNASNSPGVLLFMTIIVIYSAITGSALPFIIIVRSLYRVLTNLHLDYTLASLVRFGWIAVQREHFKHLWQKSDLQVDLPAGHLPVLYPL